MHHLDPRALIIYLGYGILASFALLLFFAPVAFTLIIPAAIYAIATSDKEAVISLARGFVALYALLTVFAPVVWALLTYFSYRYVVQNKQIEIHKGILFKRQIIIPFGKIHDITIERGPVMEVLDIATVEVHTAGVSTHHRATVKIVGVSVDEAQMIRHEYLKEMDN